MHHCFVNFFLQIVAELIELKHIHKIVAKKIAKRYQNNSKHGSKTTPKNFCLLADIL